MRNLTSQGGALMQRKPEAQTATAVGGALRCGRYNSIEVMEAGRSRCRPRRQQRARARAKCALNSYGDCFSPGALNMLLIESRVLQVLIGRLQCGHGRGCTHLREESFSVKCLTQYSHFQAYTRQSYDGQEINPSKSL